MTGGDTRMERVTESSVLGDFRVQIVRDDDGPSPRCDSNLGTMVCWHPRYSLGDRHEFQSPEDFVEWARMERGLMALPLYFYDHNGITMSTSRAHIQLFDPDGWDSCQVGWIYATRDRVLEDLSLRSRNSVVTKPVRKRALDILHDEVATYNQYLTGDVYGYVVEHIVKCEHCGHTHSKVMDSCWGFYGEEYCRTQAMEAAEFAIKNMNAVTMKGADNGRADSK